MSFEHNVFFIGPQGFREHIKTSADSPDCLAARREAILGVLSSVGARSDTWMSDGDKPKKEAGVSSKLAKAAGLPEKVVTEKPAQTPEESVEQMEKSGFLTKEQAEEVGKAFQGPENIVSKNPN